MTKSLIPKDFKITDTMREWAKIKAPTIDIDLETEAFVDYWLGHGKMMASWEATWRNWMRRAPQMGGALKTWQTEISQSSTIQSTASPEEDQKRFDENIRRLSEMKPLLKSVK